MAKAADYTAILEVDGEEWGVTDYKYEEPEDALGAALQITLADPGLVISPGALVSFRVEVTIEGETSAVYRMKDGIIAGHAATISGAGDSLRITSINAIGDKWNLAPREPVTYFDPAKVDLSEERGPARYDLFDDTGAPIITKQIPVQSLELRQVLNYAFVDGCGFSQVITNIESYPVRRFDLSIANSYRKAVAPHIDYFKPKIFADDASTLWVLFPDGKLPAGYLNVARKSRLRHNLEIEAVSPVRQIVNALLFTYRFDDPQTGDEFPATATDRTTVKATEAPTPSARKSIIASQWTKVVTTTHWKDFHDDATNPERVTRSIPWKIDRRVYTRNLQGITLEVEHTIQTDFYTRSFTLLTGYDKILYRRLQVPGKAEPMLLETLNEYQRIQWAESQYNPDVMIKINCRTWKEGLVLTEGAITGQTPEGLVTFDTVSKQPLTEANSNRNIGNDVLQFVQWEAIETEVEEWRDTGTNQVEVYRATKDELTGIVTDDTSTQAIADRQVNLAAYLTNTELLRNRDSEELYGPREPLALNAGDVPYYIARPIADKFLEREGAPPDERRLVLAHYDAALHRGSVRLIYPRTGDPAMFIITSQTEEGSKLGTMQSDIVQTAGGIKVTNA
jgi:hypothetical protein